MDFLLDTIAKLKKLGADSADILVVEEENTSVTSRLCKLEQMTQSKVSSVSLRVSASGHVCTLSSNNLESLCDNEFLEKALLCAKYSPKVDISLDPSELCGSENFSSLDLVDGIEIAPEMLIERACECESLALNTPKITNSEGCEISRSKLKFTLAKSSETQDAAFLKSFEKTISNMSLVVLASDDDSAQMAYDMSSAVYFSDLKPSAELAKRAALRAISKLGAQKIKSCKMPVIFDPFAARGLLSSFLGVVSAASVINNLNFLKDQLQKPVFNKKISIVDDACVVRGVKSAPFDADGVACRRLKIVEDGVLNSFLFNNKYAKLLGSKTTGHASSWEGIAPHNVWIEAGEAALSDMIGSIKEGLFVTDLLGVGLDSVTGNYSQGAAGILIENGKLTTPVNEITLAGNFLKMMEGMEPASDLNRDLAIASPSLFVPDLVIGGQS